MTTAGKEQLVNTGKDSGSSLLRRLRYVGPKWDFPMVDSGCSSHMTGNKAYLSDYEDYNGGFVAFGSNPKGSKITGKGLENQLNHNVKIIRCDNGTEFKNHAMNEFCAKKGIKREFSVARTPQQNGVAERKNRTLIEAARTMYTRFFMVAEDAANKEGQHQMTEDEQVMHDELEKMISQEVVAKALDDATRQAFEEEKRNIVSQKRAAQAISTNKLSIVSTATKPYVSAASTPTGANVDESSFVYLGGKIPIDASTLPNADLPTDPNMPDLEDDSNAFPNDGIFSGAYDDDDVGAEANFNNMDNTIDVSPIPTLELPQGLPKVSVSHVLYSQKDPRTYHKTLQDESWVEAMQEELLQFKLQEGDKLLYGLHQAPRAWYETLSSFLMENGYRRGTIDKTLFIKKKKSDIMLVQVYVDDIIFGSTKKSMCTEFEDCMHKRFQMSFIGELTFFLGLQVKQQPDGIFISQDKYVANILKKFDFCSIRTATTPIESNKPLVKDEDGVDVDVHVYRSMIGSLMYLFASRPDIMFAVCACARFQVTLKASHLNTVKRIFRYLKHEPKLGLWYPRDSPFELEAYSDSDYGGASLDRKSTTEYVAAANCCGQVLWIQNQMMHYGFNFMNTKIHIDNESTISVIKNLVAHSRTKHIEIRFHFIRDCYEKRLIEVIKIHTDHNVADLLTKGFDVTRFNFLVVSIGLLNIESLKRDIDGTKELLLPDLLILWLTKVSTDSVKYITAKVAGKPVNISEASIRSDLLFDDADGIDSLHNQAIFDAIQLMGYEGDLTVLTFNKALFSPQWRFLFHTMNHCISSKSTSWDQIPTNIATAVICLATNQKYNFSKLIFDGMMRHLDAKKKFVMYPRFISVFLDKQLKNVPVPLDHFPINALTSKVFSFMVKKGKHFSGNVTPLFESMLVQPTEDEGEASKRQSKPQPIPSPPHPSADQYKTQPNPSPRPSPTIPIPDSIPEGSGRNHGGQSSSDRSLSGNEDGLTLQSVYDLCVSLCKQVTDQAKEIKHLKAQIKKLKKKAKPVITHHKAWMTSVSMKQRLAGKKSLKKKWMQKESVSKQGRKPAKSEPTVHKDPAFDDLDDVDVNDAMDYMETDAYMQKGVSTKDQISTVGPDEDTNKPEVSTAKPKEVEVSTDKLDEGTAEPKDGTSDESTAPTTVFRDDETIAEFLVSMSQTKAKQKGVEIKDAEDLDRPRATSTRSVLTLKPLPKIDPKDKGKKVLEEEAESDAESEGVDEAERKFDQLAKDEEIARKARIEADRLLAARLQEEERETFTVEERAKFLYDTIAAQRRFLAQQRAAAIRSRPPTRTQLRNQMMTYLKHVGGKKHADLKNKNFEEIQVLYKKKGVVNEYSKEEDTQKVPAEQEVTEHRTKKRKSGHVKMIARKRPRPQPNDDSDDEHRKCLRIVTFDSTLDSEIMETKSFVSKLHKVSSIDGDYLVVYRVNGHFRAFNYLMKEIFRWRLYEACGVFILELKDGTVNYMLVERRHQELTSPEENVKSWLVQHQTVPGKD
ncbi:putative ribonuclease H-like domain-containing protein [Tanacetum coccineum]